jgi:hypothetical protein
LKRSVRLYGRFQIFDGLGFGEICFGSRGWFIFQALYHESAGLHPRRRLAGSVNAVTTGDATPAAPVDCFAIEPRLAEAVMQAPSRAGRWLSEQTPLKAALIRSQLAAAG